MKRWDIAVDASGPAPKLVRRAEAAAGGLGLTCSLRGTMATYPGCVHLHFKRGKGKGVVEVTVWPTGGSVRVWVSVHAGRGDAEVEAIAARLAGLLSESR